MVFFFSFSVCVLSHWSHPQRMTSYSPINLFGEVGLGGKEETTAVCSAEQKAADVMLPFFWFLVLIPRVF